METTATAIQEETFTNFPPLERGPLRFRGVFGVAWQLYKRSFKGLVPLYMLLYTLPFLLVYLPMFFSIGNVFNEAIAHGSADYMPGFPGSMFRMFGFGIFSYVALLAILFVLFPALNATMYMEMDQCANGRRGSLRQLLKAAFSVGFKQFYTTFLAYYVTTMGVSFVTMIAVYAVLFAAFIPIMLSASFSGAFPVGIVIVLVLVALVVMTAGLSFLSPIYPVAVRERLRGFKAVGRGMSLAGKRFWRIFSVMLVYMLAYMLLMSLIMAPYFASLFRLVPFGETPDFSRLFGSMGIMMAGSLLIFSLLMPYSAALHTALYIDASSRSYPRRGQPQPPEGGPVYGQPIE